MTRLVVELARLVLPVSCAGCGADDEVLCARCRALLARSPWRCEQGAGRLDLMDGRPVLPVWALADCAGPVRALVIAWKDHGRRDVGAVLAAEVARAAGALAPALTIGLGSRLAPAAGRAPLGRRSIEATSGPPLLLVPAPSTSAARRRRGEDLVAGLATAVSRGLGAAGVHGVVAPALVRGRSRDQVGLGARARARNLTGLVRVRAAQRAGLLGAPVLLVDDVLTTGATLAACERVLASAGADVIGALVLAATPPPGTPAGAPA